MSDETNKKTTIGYIRINNNFPIGINTIYTGVDLNKNIVDWNKNIKIENITPADQLRWRQVFENVMCDKDFKIFTHNQLPNPSLRGKMVDDIIAEQVKGGGYDLPETRREAERWIDYQLIKVNALQWVIDYFTHGFKTISEK